MVGLAKPECRVGAFATNLGHICFVISQLQSQRRSTLGWRPIGVCTVSSTRSQVRPASLSNLTGCGRAVNMRAGLGAGPEHPGSFQPSYFRLSPNSNLLPSPNFRRSGSPLHTVYSRKSTHHHSRRRQWHYPCITVGTTCALATLSSTLLKVLVDTFGIVLTTVSVPISLRTARRSFPPFRQPHCAGEEVPCAQG